MFTGIVCNLFGAAVLGRTVVNGYRRIELNRFFSDNIEAGICKRNSLANGDELESTELQFAEGIPYLTAQFILRPSRIDTRPGIEPFRVLITCLCQRLVFSLNDRRITETLGAEDKTGIDIICIVSC